LQPPRHLPPPKTSESDVPRNRAWKALQRPQPRAAIGGEEATPPERIHGPPYRRALVGWISPRRSARPSRPATRAQSLP
jgi:hypothetical protein